MKREFRTLVLLSEDPELRVSSEDPDPTGWLVVDAAGIDRGRVVDLVVSTDTMKVAYMRTRIADTRDVLLPATVARLDTNVQHVIYDLLTPDLLDALPDFTRLPLSPEDDARIHRAFTGREPIRPNRSASADRRRRDRRSA